MDASSRTGSVSSPAERARGVDEGTVLSSPAGHPTATGAARALALTAALLVGVNLRPAITSVSTLLDALSHTYGLDPLQRGILGALPIVTFGLAAPLGPLLARRIGVHRALATAMVLLAVALGVRVLASWTLLPGTCLAGIAIMIGATLLPPFLKSLGASGLWVGLSSMSFGVGAALGASLSVPMSRLFGAPSPSLAAWAILAAAAAAAMFAVSPIPAAAASAGSRMRTRIPPSARPTVALVTAVFALQALLYFSVTTWLPLLLVSRGADAAHAGGLLAWFSIIGLIPTLVAPVLARRRGILTWFGPGLGVVMIVGFLWFAFDGSPDAVIVTMLGIVQSAAFGLGMGLIVSLAADAASAAPLSAIAQGVGYAVAGLGSFALGALHDATDGWSAPLIAMAVISAAFSVAVALVIRRSPVSLH
ncbi:putative transporter YycB [Microbacterium azadirachtae]|uniref:Putative transporter YycB n=1 Tax=Microbacterium azadirachtae TaxID=582680 RepID=A0A0F0KH34_9MICO|nr:putative transporter YycB [Microbacterium azadirachtae]